MSNAETLKQNGPFILEILDEGRCNQIFFLSISDEKPGNPLVEVPALSVHAADTEGQQLLGRPRCRMCPACVGTYSQWTATQSGASELACGALSPHCKMTFQDLAASKTPTDIDLRRFRKEGTWWQQRSPECLTFSAVESCGGAILRGESAFASGSGNGGRIDGMEADTAHFK